MRVFKFGGASVKNAEAVKNVAGIIGLFSEEQLLVVVSAMGKTTNALEAVVAAYLSGNSEKAKELVEERIRFHKEIVADLKLETAEPLKEDLNALFTHLLNYLNGTASDNANYEYDQIVSWGEIVSTKIIHQYLQEQGLNTAWFDARTLVRTNHDYREGKVDWDTSEKLIKNKVGNWIKKQATAVAITQGFIGHTHTNQTTTLGREGSDFTGAIMAWCLDASEVSVWKDVPGMRNADPKWFDNTVRLPRISYKEAIELAYYGATIIHPKTIRPLQNKSIPLYVRSFMDPNAEGTVIQDSTASDALIPTFIFKTEQVLMSISPRDFSFIVEKHQSHIFSVFAEEQVKVNLMQHSALSFTVSVDISDRIPRLVERLKERYKVLYNSGLELATIRHYDTETMDRVTKGKEILLEQRSRFTARMVMRNL